ncbi:MAG: hypothetical protein PHE61_08485, partial [Candidatus Omnitrophica bacterium]|nr:hypothetical protein [Candidatus Omnitrophota bacterium]
MKSLFLDTVAYNVLADDNELRHRILLLKKCRKVRVIFSEYVFNELACTFLSDSAKVKAQALFKCALELASDKILKQCKTIINGECNALLDGGHNPDIYLSSREAQKFLSVVRRLGDGENGNFSCLNSVLEEKRKKYENSKEVLKKYGFIGRDKFDATYTFEQWRNDYAEQRDEFVSDLLYHEIITDPTSDKVRKVK